jgi:hypothetical protein
MTKRILLLTTITVAALVGLALLALGATRALAGPAAQSGGGQPLPRPGRPRPGISKA